MVLRNLSCTIELKVKLQRVEQVLAVDPRVGNVDKERLSNVRSALVSGIAASRHTCSQDVRVDHEREEDLRVGSSRCHEVLLSCRVFVGER